MRKLGNNSTDASLFQRQRRHSGLVDLKAQTPASNFTIPYMILRGQASFWSLLGLHGMASETDKVNSIGNTLATK